jgi:RNA polymerase sigma factor (sigma-70 family)
MTATGNPALDAGEESSQDRELLVALRAGEDAAFGKLFSRHADAVRRLARSLATDRADAEDLTAEAFFRVLQAIRRGSGPNDNVRSYLLIVTRRVAWEWRERRRDVPVSDEVLSYRAGQNPDTSGQTHERNLIARAFTSLPERWRSVLWEVEVEGERPAEVGPRIGLSPNATAALARRARRGLRAAYLQAHLSTNHGSTACRAVLEKLGAYTAGTTKGAENRRVRAHLLTCSSCQSTHDELRDVCAGLRSYAGVAAAPVAVGLLAYKGGLGTFLKGLLSSAGAKLTVAASSVSVLAVGMFGLVASPHGDGSGSSSALEFDGRNAGEMVITGANPTHPAPVSGSLSSSVPATGGVRRAADDEPKDPAGVNPPPTSEQSRSTPSTASGATHQEVAVAMGGDGPSTRQGNDVASEDGTGGDHTSSVMFGTADQGTADPQTSDTPVPCIGTATTGTPGDRTPAGDTSTTKTSRTTPTTPTTSPSAGSKR